MLVLVADFLTSVLMALTLTTCVGVLLVGVLWGLSFATARTTEGELRLAIKEYKSLREEMALQNVFLDQILVTGKRRVVWSDAVREIFAVVPPGVTIRQVEAKVEMDKRAMKSAKLVLKGNAVTRSTLTVFEGRLRSLPIVGGVNSPTTNLLERNNPTYQFDIVIKMPDAVKASAGKK